MEGLDKIKEKILEDAKREADKIIKEAELEAQRISEQAEKTAAENRKTLNEKAQKMLKKQEENPCYDRA